MFVVTAVTESGLTIERELSTPPSEKYLREFLGTKSKPIKLDNWKRRLGLPCDTYIHPSHMTMKANPLAGFMFLSDYSGFVSLTGLNGITSALKGPVIFVTQRKMSAANLRYVQLMQKLA